MTSYLSAKFEVDTLSKSNQIRVITRNLDQGAVPPAPSATYFPTEPNSLRDFLVLEYINDIVGERFVRVATLSDIASLTVLPLNTMKDATADFVTAGVVAGDLIEITLVDTQPWDSDEYASGNPFVFEVTEVSGPTQLTVATPFPCFLTGVSWEVPTRSVTGSAGVIRRKGAVAGPITFLDRKFSSFFTEAVAAQNFIIATKASMEALATAVTGAGLVDESFTAEPIT